MSQDIQQDISVSTGSTVRTILVLGDSVTAGLGIDIADAYPAQLETKLQKNKYMYTVINAGISLDTTDSLLARLPWNLQDIPDIAIVCIGANDAFQGKNPADIEKNIHEIVRTLQSKNIPILLVGMYAPRNL
jgi:acyl-CoA thioesterase-1